MRDSANETKSNVVKEVIVDPNKGLKYVIFIALGIVALDIFYMIWNAIDGYSVLGDVIYIIVDIAIGLLVLSGKQVMRYLFSALCIYNLFFKIIYFVRIIGGMSLHVLPFVVNIVVAIYYAVCLMILLTNKDVKAYFTPEQE